MWARVAQFLALERNTSLLLAALVLAGTGDRLWLGFAPKYLETLGAGVFIIGLFDALQTLLGAVYAWPGGWLTDRWGQRRSLLLFSLLSVLGYLLVLVWPHWLALLLGSFLFLAWSALSLPATFSVVATSLASAQHTMGVGVQSLVRRVPMMLGPLIGGWLVTRYGWTVGLRLALGGCIVLSLATAAFQWLMVEPAPGPGQARAVQAVGFGSVVRSFSPALRELLVSDILIRFCERIPYAFVILWAIDHGGLSAQQFGWLVAIEMATAMLCYIPVARLADRHGRRPFVLATFVFFTLFPVSLLWAEGFEWLAVAFVVRGLKEFGEPARKALIIAEAHPEWRARTFGAYYLIRDCVVTTGSLLGAWLWQLGPRVNFTGAALCGLAGTAWFWWFVFRPGRSQGRTTRPAGRVLWRRVLRRVAQGLTLLAVLTALAVAYGWRYGFQPLPQPLPGWPTQSAREPTWSEISSTNCWYWVRELQRSLPLTTPGTFGFVPAVDWQSAAAPGLNRDRAGIETINQRLQAMPAVEACFRGVLAAADGRRPSGSRLGRFEDFLAVAFLGGYPLWQAAEAAVNQQAVESFERLVDAWRFQARLAPPVAFPELFDELQGAHVNACLARPWRWLALHGPAVPLAEARWLLAELAAVTNSVNRLEYFCTQPRAGQVAYVAWLPEARWGYVRAAWRQAARGIKFEVHALGRRLWGLVSGDRSARSAPTQGLKVLRWPLQATRDALQAALAGPADLRQIEAAYVTRLVARIRNGQLTCDSETEAAWRRSWSQPGRWTRTLDRPAAWRRLGFYPDPAPFQTSLNWWLVHLESCRLTLALRAYRELHSDWPARLEDLVPDVLPAVPIDPFSHRPFAYARADGDWRFWSVGPPGQALEPEAADQPLQRMFRSNEEPRGPSFPIRDEPVIPAP